MIATVDLNIVIDVYGNRQPFVADSRAIVDWVEKRVIIGVFASHAVTTLYYAMRKGVSKPRAEEAVSYVLDNFVIANIEQRDWRSALEWGFDDFEDAAIAKVAELSGSRFIVTRNGDDFLKSPVPTVAPADLIQMLQQSGMPQPPP